MRRLHVRGRRLAGRRIRRVLVTAAIVLILLGGGWLWLRNSSMVAVTQVTVTGLSGPTAPAIRSALLDAARHMTTLHVQASRLRAAVADFQVVHDIRVSTDFPHGLRIQVIEQPPVAALEMDGRRLPVTADGRILSGVPVPQHLAAISVAHPQAGTRLTDRRALKFLAVVAGAPPPLRSLVARVYVGGQGLTAQLRAGPALYFGDTVRLDAKWIAAARVLADPSSSGASYLDLRIPDRPVAAVPNAQALYQRAVAGVVGAGTATTPAGTATTPAGTATATTATATAQAGTATGTLTLGPSPSAPPGAATPAAATPSTAPAPGG
jgi:cell division protein FtsQ